MPMNEEYALISPLVGVFEVTSRCNLHCPHCFVFPKKEIELPLEDAQKVISDLKDLGILMLCISGGEPFIREDITDLVDFAMSQKIPHILIPSNCTLIDDGIINHLKNYKGKITIMVSLDASTPEAYDQFRNTQGSFQEVINTVEKLQNAAISVSAATVMDPLTIEGLPHMYQLLKRLNINRWFIDRIQPPSDSNDVRCHDPSPEQLKKAFQFLFETQKVMHVSFGENLKHLWWLIEREPWFPTEQVIYSKYPKCEAGKTSITITSSGDVIPCVQWREKVGNALTESLRDLWFHSALFKELRSLTTDQIEFCSHCSHVLVCGGGCRAMARRWGKSLNTPDPRCILTERRCYNGSE